MIKILQQINKTPRRKKHRKHVIRLSFTFITLISNPSCTTSSITQTSQVITCSVSSAMSHTRLSTIFTIPPFFTFFSLKKNIEIVNTYAMFTHVKKKRDIERTIQTFIMYHDKLSLYFLDTLPLSSRDYIRNTLHFVCCKFCFYSSQGTGYHIQSHRHQI